MAWDKIGSLRKNKNGGFYIKVDKSVTLSEGQVLSVQDPRKKLAESVEAKRISQEKADEILTKIPDYIRYELYVTPPMTKK